MKSYRPSPENSSDFIYSKITSYNIVVINDIHLDLDYKPGSSAECISSLCCESTSIAKNPSNPNQKKAGYWGTLASCDLPIHTLEESLKVIKEKIKPDMIYWLGDNAVHKIELYNSEMPLEYTKTIVRKFVEILKDYKVFPVLGNHENIPADQYNFLTKQFSEITKLYEPIFVDKDTYKQFEENRYYKFLDTQKNQLIIGLDTTAGDSLNISDQEQFEDPGGQIDWLQKSLKQAEESSQKVHILLHIPVGGFDMKHNWSKHQIVLIRRYRKIVTGIFSGHTHNDQLKWFFDDEDSAEVIVRTEFVMPSQTTSKYGNPSFRNFYVNEFSNEIVNYDQWRLDLAEENLSGKDIFGIAYNFQEEYQLKDMSNQSMKKQYQKLQDQDSNMYKKYFKNYFAGSEIAIDNYGGGIKDLGACDFQTDSEELWKCLGLTKILKMRKSEMAASLMSHYIGQDWVYYLPQ